MKIQCVLHRPGGTVTDIGGIQYHFEELPDGAHVADVELEAHIDRFLAIPEGYKVYHGTETPVGKPVEIGSSASAPAPTPDTEVKKPHQLNGSSALPPEFDIGGVTLSLSEVVQKSFDASGLSADEWNSLDEEERTAKIEITLDDLAEAAEAKEKAAAAKKAAAKKAAAKKTTKKAA